MAVILILLRCGLNLKPAVIRSSWARFCSLGFLTTTAEAAAIFVFSSLVLDIPTAMAAAFAFVLLLLSRCTHCKEKKLGGEIPTILLAAATIDNIFCIAAFSVISRILLVLLSVPLQIVTAGVVGGVIGFLLRFFPRPGMSACSFLRCTLLSFVSTALFFGSKAAGYEAFGPIAVVVVCFVAAIEWKAGGGEAGKDEEAFFRLMWTLVFQPMLFVLIGLLFDFSKITWKGTAMALLVLAVGVFVRFVSVLLTTLPMELKKEPKALHFGLLLPESHHPSRVGSADRLSGHRRNAHSHGGTCVLSILLTAPLGQLIIDQLGVVLLAGQAERFAERSAEIEEKSV
ncbi:hypothetical protein M3Y99_00022100 [Aphelenchoides fujianensis]|nr:hypothetical protein M3Y99_00022100 [Aphelenchoides fujianensis]